MTDGTNTGVKVCFVASDRVMTEIKKIAYDRDLTMTEIIRHALAVEAFLHDTLRPGSRVFIEHRDGERLLIDFREEVKP